MKGDIIETIVIEEISKNKRAYDSLNGKFEKIPSRKALKKLLDKGLIYKGALALKSGDHLMIGDTIHLYDEIKHPNSIYHKTLEILFEDCHIAIIVKPAGIIVSGNRFKTIYNMLPHNLQPSKEYDALVSPQPVHRLDELTSGILIVAKTYRARVKLAYDFEKNTITKSYIAICHGSLNATGVINQKVNDKHAKTKFKTLANWSDSLGKEYSMLSLSPVTGRKHQIRVHLSNIGHPILGDIKYCLKESTIRKKGLYLFANEVVFNHPISNQTLSFHAPLPKKFQRIKQLQTK